MSSQKKISCVFTRVLLYSDPNICYQATQAREAHPIFKMKIQIDRALRIQEILEKLHQFYMLEIFIQSNLLKMNNRRVNTCSKCMIVCSKQPFLKCPQWIFRGRVWCDLLSLYNQRTIDFCDLLPSAIVSLLSLHWFSMRPLL